MYLSLITTGQESGFIVFGQFLYPHHCEKSKGATPFNLQITACAFAWTPPLRCASPWAKYRPTFTSHNDRSTLTGHGLLASLHRKLSENSKNISEDKKGKWIELLSWFYKFFINPNWHVAGHFYPPCNFGIEFCQLNLYKKFTNFFGGENWQQLE